MLVNINCDMGEGIGNDEAIMPFITSANIACGYHAGDAETLRHTLELCMKHSVGAGAHVSFLDRPNFGRTELSLSTSEIHDLVFQQLYIFYEIAEQLDIKPTHVKPHGALYNMSARDPFIAAVIAGAVDHFDSSLKLFGLSGSHSIREAEKAGLQVANEVFADRTYQDDGSLTPRTQPNALIENEEDLIRQVSQMIKEQSVTTLSGKIIPIKADTICIHGDGKHALSFAKAIDTAFNK